MSTKRRPVFSFVVALLSVICLCLGLFTTRSYATDASDSFGISGSKMASPTELTQDNRQTEVTLSLPSAEHENEYDVVFVMDSSTSLKNNQVNFDENVQSLLSSIADKDATVNVGVIKFKGKTFDTISMVSDGAQSGLTPYSDDTAAIISAAVNVDEDTLEATSKGTNLHGGLDLADEWLTADNNVPNSHKYVIVLTDGKSYIWNNDDNVPTTYYTQYYQKQRIKAGGVPSVGQSTGSYDKVAGKKEVGGQTVFYSDSYQDIYSSDHPMLTGASKYDQRCGYAFKEGSTMPGTVATPAYPITNGLGYDYNSYYEFTPSDPNAAFMSAYPYALVDNGDGTYSYDKNSVNTEFYQYLPDSLQKGLYMAGHLWTDMGSKYNTAAITYSGWNSQSGLAVAKDFCTWIKDNSDYGADISNSDEVAALFDSIEKEIIYMVDSGTVTDQIPDEFTLVEDGTNTFKMTLAGEDLACAADGDNAWNFGSADDQGVFPYRVEYDKASNSFKWFINVPVENAKKVTLSYTLEIDEDAATGEHDTNVSAMLDYITTDDKEGTFTFEIPVVTYTMTTDFTVEKVWDDADDADGLRPDSLDIQLLADGKAYGDPVTITEGEGWSYTWDGLPVNDADQSKITYSVEELEIPEGYEAAINESENGIVITNSHYPLEDMTDFTVKKVWEDNNDSDHIRPKSIAVQLYADGEPFGEPKTLTADDGWAITFQQLLVHAEDGHVIEYTAEETKVPEGYTASVEVAHRVATITNTHSDDVTPAPTPTPDKGKKRVMPQTSDLLSPGTIGTLVCLAGLALGAAFVMRRHSSGK